MDPEANQEEQIRIASAIIRAADAGEPVDSDDAARLAELVIALHDWIMNGNFLPRTWASAQRRGGK